MPLARPQTAIAGAIDLRCYCLAEARSDGQLSLDLPDLGYSQSWDLSTLPWHLVDPALATSAVLKTGPKPDLAPSTELLTLLANQFVHQDQLKAVQAAQAFLYLYMHLAAARGGGAAPRPAQSFTVRSGLPISAGLGSSAAYSVALSSALLYSHGVLPLPSSSSSSSIDRAHADLVNAHAFLAEKVIHGTPSGIDNTVATLGGAVAFRRAVKGREGRLDVIEPQEGRGIRFLLTDTKVPRDTKTLVAGVARRKLEVRRALSSSSLSLSLSSSRAGRADLLWLAPRTGARHDQPAVRLDPAHQRLGARAPHLGVGRPRAPARRTRPARRPEPRAPRVARRRACRARGRPEHDEGRAMGLGDQADGRGRRWVRGDGRAGRCVPSLSLLVVLMSMDAPTDARLAPLARPQTSRTTRSPRSARRSPRPGSRPTRRPSAAAGSASWPSRL